MLYKQKMKKKMLAKSLITALAISQIAACSVLNLSNRPTPLQNENFVILKAGSDDSLESLAETWLGDKENAWQIAEFNNIQEASIGQQIAIPLNPVNPTGFFTNGHQRIPILCYHRFDDKHEKLSVPEQKFSQQMQYLYENNYKVIPLSYMIDFLQGKRALPEKSVVITIDDGYRSTIDTAFPILKKYNFPATVFLYTDFMNARDALRWDHIKTMHSSGLISFQPHSKTHPNMSLRIKNESDKQYSLRLNEEIRDPGEKIQRTLRNNMHTFAYPFGDTNQLIIGKLKTLDYHLGVTVQPGSNGAFAYPFMLKRTMIFGDFNEDDFARSLETFRKYTKS